MISARTLWVLAIALAGCYGSRSPDENDDLSGNSVFSERAGQPAMGTAGKAGDPKPAAGGKSGGAGGKGGSAACSAIRRDPTSPEGSDFDTAAFSGIGGAGAMLASACKRCGWDSRGDACQELVYTVPTITDPLYGPCVTASIDFASCLERESCICNGPVPAACAASKRTLDQCLNTGTSSMDVSTPPSEWISADSHCGYTFKAPPDYFDAGVMGVDSCLLQFSAGDCTYLADYGAFTSSYEPMANDRDFIKRQVQIDGHDAELITFSTSSNYFAGVYFPKLADGAGMQMRAICRSSAGPYEASMVFRSLIFQQPARVEPARQPAVQSCVRLDAPSLDSGSDDLQIQYACGLHSAHAQEYSGFLDGTTRCETPQGINTFALKLTGRAAARYSAVVRCGYIRYDNGTFVGSRVETEARDGQWCHEPALSSIQLADRMLLTDVAFEIEALDKTAPAKHLAVQFLTRAGSTRAVPAEDNLCLYVAHRAPGNWTCGMVAPASYCTCPCDPAWDDFPTAMTLSLTQTRLD